MNSSPERQILHQAAFAIKKNQIGLTISPSILPRLDALDAELKRESDGEIPL